MKPQSRIPSDFGIAEVFSVFSKRIFLNEINLESVSCFIAEDGSVLSFFKKLDKTRDDKFCRVKVKEGKEHNN